MRSLVLVAVAVGTLAGAAAGTTTAGCTSALIVSAKSGKVLRRLPQPVDSVVADGGGGWYVADSRLWHLQRDGSVDESWHSPVRRGLGYGAAGSAPGMLARFRDRLYLAGRRRVVAVDAATGRVLWRSPSVAGPILFGRRPTITGLAVGSGRVYVGGTFAHFGPAKRGGLAALDASTGHLLSWQAPPLLQQAPGRIYSPGSATRLALSASRIYVVGAFNQVGVGRRRFARPGVAAVRRSDGRLTGFPSSSAHRGARLRRSVGSPRAPGLWCARERLRGRYRRLRRSYRSPGAQVRVRRGPQCERGWLRRLDRVFRGGFGERLRAPQLPDRDRHAHRALRVVVSEERVLRRRHRDLGLGRPRARCWLVLPGALERRAPPTAAHRRLVLP